MEPEDACVGGDMLWLASASPRRRDLLARAGVRHEVVTTGIDDGELRAGSVGAAAWASALAYLKARAGAERVPGGWVLGADTVCVLDGRILGQPGSRSDAAEMISSFAGRDHEVVTGVALVKPGSGERRIFADTSVVTVGPVGAGEINEYLDSGNWRGKAGGYNLEERIGAGWAIRCDGDHTSVMGLPMARLLPALRELGLADGDGLAAAERACSRS